MYSILLKGGVLISGDLTYTLISIYKEGIGTNHSVPGISRDPCTSYHTNVISLVSAHTQAGHCGTCIAYV